MMGGYMSYVSIQDEWSYEFPVKADRVVITYVSRQDWWLYYLFERQDRWIYYVLSADGWFMTYVLRQDGSIYDLCVQARWVLI